MSNVKIAAGTSAAADTDAAVREAVGKARAALGVEPRLAILGATVDHDAARVHAAVRELLPSVALHGATSSLGVLGSEGVVMGAGGGVGVLLLGGEGGVRFASASASLEGGARRAGRAAAEALGAGEKPRLVFMAATPGDEEEILAGIREALPGVPVYGGSAADHAIEGAWSIFTDAGPRREGVSLAAAYGDLRVGAAFDGPYQPTDKRAVITAATGRSIASLGGRPATAVLREWIGERIDEQVREGGNLLMQTALSPVAIAHPTEGGAPYHLLLHPAQAKKDGSVDLFAQATPGATLCLMRGSEQSLVDLAGTIADQALAAGHLAPADVRGAFLIYCAGCAGAIGGGRLSDVMARLRERLGPVPVLGFCTFGEQGFVPGLGNVHGNLSVALVLLG